MVTYIDEKCIDIHNFGYFFNEMGYWKLRVYEQDLNTMQIYWLYSILKWLNHDGCRETTRDATDYIQNSWERHFNTMPQP